MQRWNRSANLMLLGALLVASGCGGERSVEAGDSAVASAAPATAVDPPAPAPARSARDSSADPAFETSLAPLHDVELLARVSGEVVALDVEEGDRVASGRRLAQVDDRDKRATLDEREAALAAKEAAWGRAQRLHDQKLISEEQFIAARSDWQVARAQRDRAKLDWEHCAVRAPFAGLVALRKVQRGQMVKEGDLLFRVCDPDRLRAELLLPEARLGTIRPGQSVLLVPVAGGASTLASVSRVSPLVDAASGTFRVTIDVDNRRARLPAGVTVRVEFGADRSARR